MARITLAAFGDSLTEGYGLPAYSSFPAQLERKLLEEGCNLEISNYGISGETSADGLSRLADVIESKPDAAYIEFGANDCFQLVDPEQIKLNIMAIIEAFQEAHIPVILLGFMPMNFTPQSYALAFNSIFPDLAQKYNIPFYANLMEGLDEKPEYYQSDGIHPNNEGVSIIVKNIFPLFKTFYEELTAEF